MTAPVVPWIFLPLFRQTRPLIRWLSRMTGQFSVGHNTIVIYCFHTVVQWYDGSMPDGTAGAEEAVVYMARYLVQQGWRVLVYNNCREKRVVHGVTYCPQWSYNPYRHADVTVVWRSWEVLQEPLGSRKTYMWLHNVEPWEHVPPRILRHMDKAIFVSRFHRNTWRGLPDERVFVTRNGIELEHLSQDVRQREVLRNPKRAIYASSPDRGLECLLRLWPAIRERVPEAELFVFYGWGDFDFWARQDIQRQELKCRLLELLDQPGVMARNLRVEPAALCKEFELSGVWLYPTEVRETSCICGMKAQASGAFPIVTACGALAETVKWGDRIEAKDIYTNVYAQRQFVEAAVRCMLAPDESARQRMIEWATKAFGWQEVAKEWDREFRGGQEIQAESTKIGLST